MFTHKLQRRIALLSLSAGLALGCTKTTTTPPHGEATAEPASRAAAPVEVLPHPALTKLGAGASIADVTERVMPSVVNISLTKLSRVRPTMPFPFFFGPPDAQERREQGMGSGVIVSADGFILTNNHVVAEASEIKVTTWDRREYDATVVGTDPKSDLAVIQIKGNVSGLQPVQFGDSSRLRLGDVVLAIGNPFGVGQTVTMGIVSAKGRADLGIVDYEDFIQTDAAINPGNSGGALVNMEGQLVGVNTAILSRSGGYQGIGFAIPTNMAMPIMESLKKNGRVVRGWLGVGIQEVDAEIAQAMKLPAANGVLLSDVRPGGPAAKSGLRRGDVVTKLDGSPITSVGQFRNAIAASGAGRNVSMELYREGKVQTVGVALGEMPGDEAAALPGSAPSAPAAASALDGVTLEELHPQNRRAFQIPGELQRGVVVTSVDGRSPAARAGLRPGDVLLEVNRSPVGNLREFQEAYAKAKGNVLFLVSRRGSTVFLVVRR
jgi:serine protease Do